jgi:hypothetical protein
MIHFAEADYLAAQRGDDESARVRRMGMKIPGVIDGGFKAKDTVSELRDRLKNGSNDVDSSMRRVLRKRELGHVLESQEPFVSAIKRI